MRVSKKGYLWSQIAWIGILCMLYSFSGVCAEELPIGGIEVEEKIEVEENKDENIITKQETVPQEQGMDMPMTESRAFYANGYISNEAELRAACRQGGWYSIDRDIWVSSKIEVTAPTLIGTSDGNYKSIYNNIGGDYHRLAAIFEILNNSTLVVDHLILNGQNHDIVSNAQDGRSNQSATVGVIYGKFQASNSWIINNGGIGMGIAVGGEPWGRYCTVDLSNCYIANNHIGVGSSGGVNNLTGVTCENNRSVGLALSGNSNVSWSTLRNNGTYDLSHSGTLYSAFNTISGGYSGMYVYGGYVRSWCDNISWCDNLMEFTGGVHTAIVFGDKLAVAGTGIQSAAAGLYLSQTEIAGATNGVAQSGGTLHSLSDYDYYQYQAYNPDVARAFGSNQDATFQHWLDNGIIELRTAADRSSIQIYNCSENGVSSSYGTVRWNWGAIHDNGKDGMGAFLSTVHITGGDFYNNANGMTIVGDSTIQGGSSHNNKNGFVNYGVSRILGGEFMHNTSIGIDNQGSLYVTGGTISGNQVRGVYQNGYFDMSGNAAVDENNTIYLERDKVISLSGNLLHGSCGRIDLASGDKAVGRVLLDIIADKSGASDMLYENKFHLAFTVNDVDGKDGQTHTAGIRAGIRNGHPGVCNLSGIYQVIYDGNLAGNPLITVTFSPEKETAYWMEAVSFATAQRAKPMYQSQDIGNTLFFTGWCLEQAGQGERYQKNHTMALDHNLTMYAIWQAQVNLNFRGNGATQGEDFVVEQVSGTYQFPENPFSREEEASRFQPNTGQELPYTYRYSWQGWHGNSNADYHSNGIWQAGDLVDITSFFMEQLGIDKVSFDDAGTGAISIYAVWDQYPLLDTYDIFLTDVQADAITEEFLLGYVQAEDKEDGVLEKGTQIKVLDFSLEDFKNLGESGEVALMIQAMDGAGNYTQECLQVHVSTSAGIPVREYIRFIDYDNYKKPSREEGGLEADSLWYHKEEYQKLLMDAFHELKRISGK